MYDEPLFYIYIYLQFKSTGGSVILKELDAHAREWEGSKHSLGGMSEANLLCISTAEKRLKLKNRLLYSWREGSHCI